MLPLLSGYPISKGKKQNDFHDNFNPINFNFEAELTKKIALKRNNKYLIAVIPQDSIFIVLFVARFKIYLNDNM